MSTRSKPPLSPRHREARHIAPAAGVSPLLLHVAFGPKDGNPIGLGLLAVAAVPIGALVAAVGLIKTLVQLLAGRGS